MEQILLNLKSNINKSIDFFKKEIAIIRTSRASPALIEDILIDYYGQKLPLKQLASISVPQPNVLIMEVWDKNAIEAIAKSPAFSKFGYNPVVDGKIIRIVLPSLTQERRKELMKLLNQKSEESKATVRSRREDALRELKKIEKDISEDEKFRIKNEIQKIIDGANKQIAELVERKEKELSQ